MSWFIRQIVATVDLFQPEFADLKGNRQLSGQSRYPKLRRPRMIFAECMLIGFLLAAGAVEIKAEETVPGSNSPPVSVSQPSTPFSKSNELSAYKSMSLEQLMNQDVTSVSKGRQPYATAPAAIVVITQEDIRRSGASSIPEALRLADNLDVAQKSSSAYDISARGFNGSVGNKLLVLIDGRSVYTPLFSGIIWNMQDYLLEDIDRIEVISGPGGTLWGANAVNGVINIITKDAKDTQGFYSEAGGGSFLEDFVSVRYGGTLGSNVYYRVYGKYFDRGSEAFSDGKSANDAWNRGQGGFRIDSETDQNHLTLEGDLFGGHNESTPGGEGTPEASATSSGGHILGRWMHTIAEDSDMSLQLYYDRTDLGAPFQSSGAIPAGTLHDHLDTYDLDFQDRFGFANRHEITWGLGYRFTHDFADPAPLVAFLPATLDQNLFSGFIQDQIKLHEKLFLTLGSKLEHNDYTGFEYEPSGRLQWNPSTNQMIWGAVSRAVRTPSRYDRNLFEPSPAYGTFLAGNGAFTSETVIAYELGYRAQLAPKISTSLSTFYNDYQQVRTLNFTAPLTLPLIFENNLSAQTYGFELSADYQASEWWRLHAGYDFLKEHVNIGPGGDLYNGYNEMADPQNQIFLRSSMDLPGNMEFDTALRWIDAVHNNNGGTPGSVRAYTELDAHIAWRPTRNVEVAIVGQNLLHNQHAEAGFPDSSQEQIRRSFYGKVSCRF